MINKWDLPNNRAAPLSTTTGPSPDPSPAGRGVITELPLTSCCSLLVVLFAVVSHVFLHSLSPYFICLNTSVQYVHSVYLCLSVILSINIKNTTKHVHSVYLCLSVILSINIKNTTKHVLFVILCLSVILSINIKNTTKHVLFVILCLSVILSINIKNTTKHVYSGIICLSIILSLYINFPFSMYALSVSVTYMKSRCCRLR